MSFALAELHGRAHQSPHHHRETMTEYKLPQSEIYTRWQTLLQKSKALKKRLPDDFVMPELEALVKDVVFLRSAALQEPRLDASLLALANDIVSSLEIAFSCRCTACSAHRKTAHA